MTAPDSPAYPPDHAARDSTNNQPPITNHEGEP